MMRVAAVMLFVLALIAACGGTDIPDTRTPEASPTGVRVPTLVATSATPISTPGPTVNAFPPLGQKALAEGIYSSSPPFDLPFTFRVPAEGWSSAHVHHDFFDVMRFDGEDPVAPTAWVAWALPQTVIGTGTQPASGLTPDQAASLMSSKPGVTAGAQTPFTFLDRDGVQLDLRAGQPNLHIFGSADGNFGLDPAYPMRFGIVDNQPGLMFVLCLLQDGDAAGGCGQESRQIIESSEQ